jgi:heavy metal sensor kinase
VLFQVLVLAVASAVSAYAIYQLVSQPLLAASDGVLYGQWATVAGGLSLQQDGAVAYAGGELPGTYGDPPTPVETAVFTRDGELVAQSRNDRLPGPELLTRLQPVLNGGGAMYFDAAEPGSPAPRRGYADLVQLGEQPNQVTLVVAVTKSTADVQAAVLRLLLTLIAGALLVVAVGGALAWVLVGRALRPVHALAEAARSISEQDLYRRVEVPAPDDEVGDLKDTFNQLLARLEQSFSSLRRFTADASHELRSPLTLMRTEVEVALARARDRSDYERVLRSLQGEIEHMSQIVDQLLLLAQSDAGDLRLLRTRIDVADFIEETAARWQAVAEERKVTLEVEAPASGHLHGDPVLLRRVLDNLLDNALRYSPTLAPVTLSATGTERAWLIEVADQGPGVAEPLRERIFDRFARAETARTRRGGGSGLGLALSAAVVRAHGGVLELVEGSERGARFRVRLPVSGADLQ